MNNFKSILTAADAKRKIAKEYYNNELDDNDREHLHKIMDDINLSIAKCNPYVEYKFIGNMSYKVERMLELLGYYKDFNAYLNDNIIKISLYHYE